MSGLEGPEVGDRESGRDERSHISQVLNLN
jgi:hypothetical protein